VRSALIRLTHPVQLTRTRERSEQKVDYILLGRRIQDGRDSARVEKKKVSPVEDAGTFESEDSLSSESP